MVSLNTDMETSSGAVIFTVTENKIRYLLIEDNHHNIGFPKGHIEKDETLLQTAQREILEEVGLHVDFLDGFKEELRYLMPNGIEKRAVYFLATYKDQQFTPQAGEVENILLLDYDEALKQLTFDNIKPLFEKADKIVRSKYERNL